MHRKKLFYVPRFERMLLRGVSRTAPLVPAIARQPAMVELRMVTVTTLRGPLMAMAPPSCATAQAHGLACCGMRAGSTY